MSAIGKVGFVTVATKGNQGPGEVNVPGLDHYVAWSRDPLTVGTQVLVTVERGVRAVGVDPL